MFVPLGPSPTHRGTGSPCKTRPRPAFTLIELLVVIAIIAILAAILFPVFAQAREKARQISCLSNMKQMGLAILQYNQDFDETYPVSYYANALGKFSAAGTPVSWPRIIQPYVKNTRIFQCPSEKSTVGNTPGTGDDALTRYPVSYSFNYFLTGNFSPTGIAGSNLVKVQKPAQTVMIVDGASQPKLGVKPEDWSQKKNATAVSGLPDTANRSAWLLVHAGTQPVINFADYGAPLARHTGSLNILWADGHVKSAKIESFYHVPGQPEEPYRPTGYSDYWSPCLEPDFGCP